jgi:hypothetical protein
VHWIGKRPSGGARAAIDEGSGTWKHLVWLDGSLAFDGRSRGGAGRHGSTEGTQCPMNTQGSMHPQLEGRVPQQAGDAVLT